MAGRTDQVKGKVQNAGGIKDAPARPALPALGVGPQPRAQEVAQARQVHRSPGRAG